MCYIIIYSRKLEYINIVITRQDYIDSLLLDKATIEKHLALLSAYPYIQVSQIECDKSFFYCKEVNSLTVNVYMQEILMQNERLVFANPYALIEGIQVYSDPYFFEVGFSNFYGEGCFKNPDWKNDLVINNISSTTIALIEQYFIDNKATYHRPPLFFDPLRKK